MDSEWCAIACSDMAYNKKNCVSLSGETQSEIIYRNTPKIAY